MIEALLWAILFVLTFGLSRIQATHPATPWVTTFVVLVITGILSRFFSRKEKN